MTSDKIDRGLADVYERAEVLYNQRPYPTEDWGHRVIAVQVKIEDARAALPEGAASRTEIQAASKVLIDVRFRIAELEAIARSTSA